MPGEDDRTGWQYAMLVSSQHHVVRTCGFIPLNYVEIHSLSEHDVQTLINVTNELDRDSDNKIPKIEITIIRYLWFDFDLFIFNMEEDN